MEFGTGHFQVQVRSSDLSFIDSKKLKLARCRTPVSSGSCCWRRREARDAIRHQNVRRVFEHRACHLGCGRISVTTLFCVGIISMGIAEDVARFCKHIQKTKNKIYTQMNTDKKNKKEGAAGNNQECAMQRAPTNLPSGGGGSYCCR